MSTLVNEFTPAWNVIAIVEKQCHRAFMCDEITTNDDVAFTAFIYAAYKDPRRLIPKFAVAGAQVIRISGGYNNWWHYTFVLVETS